MNDQSIVTSVSGLYSIRSGSRACQPDADCGRYVPKTPARHGWSEVDRTEPVGPGGIAGQLPLRATIRASHDGRLTDDRPGPAARSRPSIDRSSGLLAPALSRGLRRVGRCVRLWRDILARVRAYNAAR